MKKKLLALAVSAAVVVALAGCSNGEISNEYIKISQYKGIEITEQTATEITDADVESQIEGNLDTAAVTTEITDRAVESGDTATIDYTGSVDGVEFEGGSATDYDLVIGSGAFIEGFEDQIIGHESGEAFDVKVTFPEDYRNTDLAGKDAVFAVTIKSISQSETPELTDDWVKENSESAKTVDEYKKEVKADLEESNEKSYKDSLGSAAMAAVLEKTEVIKYPDGDVEEQEEAIKNQYTSMAEYYSMEFADFLEQYLGMSEEDFNAQVKEAAQTAVKQNLACELIANKENLEPSDKEYEEGIQQYAEDYGYESSDAMIEQVGEDQLKSLILQEKVAGWLADNCVQVKAEESTDTTTESSDATTESSDTTTESSDTAADSAGTEDAE